ncbi:MAG: hypothetical protein N2Z74_01340 [Syntrophales bacterium]|nr:hypothetical protein [Syntrophales bacterium]
MTTEETPKKNIRMDQHNLYREEIFTDLKIGSIRQLTPVKVNGELDKGRKILYFGQSQIVTPHGPLPIQFPIEAKNLAQAVERFSEGMEAFMARMIAEAKEMQRQEQSRIVIPSAPAPDRRIIIK